MSDMVLGTLILIVFLIVVFIAGYFLYRFKNARLTGAWGPLVSLVNGKVVGDGGGGATSWLTGTYKSRKVQASMTPGRNMYSSNPSESNRGTYNYFESALADVPGKYNWRVEFNRAVLGVGQTGWRVQSEDRSVENSLDAANVVALISPFGEPPSHLGLSTVEYNSREHLLLYREDAGSRWTPTPERFTEELELLLRLEDVNARVNPA